MCRARQPIAGSASSPMSSRLFFQNVVSPVPSGCSGATTLLSGFPNGMVVFGAGTTYDWVSKGSCTFSGTNAFVVNNVSTGPQIVQRLWVKPGRWCTVVLWVPRCQGVVAPQFVSCQSRVLRWPIVLVVSLSLQSGSPRSALCRALPSLSPTTLLSWR